MVQSSNEGIIVCSIEKPTTAGANPVAVYVGGRGLAASLGGKLLAVATTNALNVSRVSPEATSMAGGGLITLTGEQRWSWSPLLSSPPTSGVAG